METTSAELAPHGVAEFGRSYTNGDGSLFLDELLERLDRSANDRKFGKPGVCKKCRV
jgi:hypothetical protein